MRMGQLGRSCLASAAAVALFAAPAFGKVKTGAVTIGAMAMHVDGYFGDVPFTVSWNASELTVTGPAGRKKCFNAGVDLPEGARPTVLRVWAAAPSNGVFVQFTAQKLTSGATTNLVNDTTDQGSAERKRYQFKLPKTAAVADGETAYGFGVC